jgi:hypothetical protein
VGWGALLIAGVDLQSLLEQRCAFLQYKEGIKKSATSAMKRLNVLRMMTEECVLRTAQGQRARGEGAR